MPASLFPTLTTLRRLRRWRTDYVVVNRQCRRGLSDAGFANASSFDQLTGEIISGHSDRHVIATEIGSEPVVLKREHRIRVKTRLWNWLAGFGPSSLAAREAIVLDRLSKANVPVPQWLAYGEHAGRAFLVMQSEQGRDLRDVLQFDGSISNRKAIARNLGRAVANVLRAGFTCPDLSAKHVLIRRDRSVVLLDWPRAGRLRKITSRSVVNAIAGLHASIRPGLATAKERMLFLRTCLCVLRLRIDVVQTAKQAIRSAARIERKRSIREQHVPIRHDGHDRLRWIDGEQLCVTRRLWQSLSGKIPQWLSDAAHARCHEPAMSLVNIPSIGTASCLQVPKASNWSIWLGRLTGRPVRSPTIAQAGQLFRHARHGVDAPRVLAFGGRPDGGGFLLIIDENTQLVREAA